MAFLLAVAAACGDNSRPLLPDAAAPPPGPGELRVVVTGLPDGVPARVLVAGPDGFHTVLSATRTLGDLAPGTYEIVPHAVTGDTPDVGYTAEGDVAQVEVSATAGAEANVTYTALETILADDAVLADDALANSLESLVREDDGEVTLRFASTTPMLSALAPGDLLVMPPTPGAPYGFLGRVETVNGLVVTARDAPPEDLMKQGVIAFSHPISAAQARGVMPIVDDRTTLIRSELVPARTLIEDGTFPATLSVDSVCLSDARAIEAGVGVGAALILETETCFGGTAHVSASINLFDSSKSWARFDLGGTVTSTVRGTAVGTGGINVSIPIAQVPLTNWVAAGPFVWVPYLIVYVHPSGEVSAGITTAVSQSFGVAAGVYMTSNGAWPYASASYAPTVEYPRPVANATLRLATGPFLSYQLYGAGGGPELGFEAYTRFDVDLLAQPPTPAWTLRGGVDFVAGVSLLSGFLRYSGTVPILERTLLTATSAPPAGTVAPSVGAGESGLHVAIAGDDTVVFAGAEGTVIAYTPDGIELWRRSVNTQGFRSPPAIGDDGTIYLTGFDNELYALSPEGAVLWSQPLGGWARLAIGADGTLYVAMFGVLEARDPAAMGTVLWTLPLPGFNPSDNFIIGPDGTLYLPGFGGELAAVNPAASPAERLLWLKTVTDFSLRTPALSSDGTTLYVTVDSPNRLLAVSAQTGDPLWSRQYAWSEVGAPPVVAPDGTIYAAAPANDSFDNVGRLVAFTPDGTPKWIYTGGRMEGAPAVAKNGTVVVASKDGHLHAVSPQGTPIFVRSVLGLPESAVVIDRRGAAIVTGRCPYNHPTTCGITRVFTGADGPADSWSKEQGSLANTGRR